MIETVNIFDKAKQFTVLVECMQHACLAKSSALKFVKAILGTVPLPFSFTNISRLFATYN